MSSGLLRRFRELAASIIRAIISLMMEAASTSETWVNFYQHNNPDDSHLHTLRRENLKSHKDNYVNYTINILICSTILKIDHYHSLHVHYRSLFIAMSFIIRHCINLAVDKALLNKAENCNYLPLKL
jgi:hypothetical protein